MLLKPHGVPILPIRSPTGAEGHTWPRRHPPGEEERDGVDETATYLIHSHHLLDHKPDNLVLSGRKFKLTGMAVLGRPGVALCVGAPSNADKFLGRLRKAMPQKKLSSSRAGWTSRGSSRSTASSAGRWRNCGRR